MMEQEKVNQLINMFAEMRRALRKGPFGVRLDISKVQCEVLWEIQKGARRVADIARALQVTSSAVTQMVNQLVVAGYITRVGSENDRRETVIQLTAKGQNMLRELHAAMQTRAHNIAAALTDQELASYIAISHKIADYTKEAEG